MMWKNLYSLLEEKPNQLFLLTKAHILYDIATGLQYLHKQKHPVIHKDLNPSNILLTENLNAKIAGFAHADRFSNKSEQKLSTAKPQGNIAYMAPEVLAINPTYDTKLDVFSFGCTIIHVVTERYPNVFLSTNKIWSTLIDKLKKVGELAAAREEIIEELVDMYT